MEFTMIGGREHPTAIRIGIYNAGTCGDSPGRAVHIAVNRDRRIGCGKQRAGRNRAMVFKHHCFGILGDGGIEGFAIHQFGGEEEFLAARGQ